MTLKAAFIGTGGIARTHARNIVANDGYKLVAACDLDGERVKKFAEEFDIPHHYTNAKKMMTNEDLDVVLVCTPNYAHKGPTIECLKAGINVYCEKPMAMNVNEARAMVKAAKDSKATLTIGHHQRFTTKAQFLHKARMAGDLGDIYFCRCGWHRRGGVPWWGAFHIMAKSGGGALIDIGVHATDLALWLMGSPNPVQVTGKVYRKLATKADGNRPNQSEEKHKEFDVDDFGVAFVKMDNGATMAIECSWAANLSKKSHQILELFGDNGGATIDPFEVMTQQHGQFVNIEPVYFDEPQPHGQAVEHFRRVILGHAENLVKPEETLNVQKILDGIYKSSETGKPVNYKPGV